MSGHSHFKTIKYKKEASDKKRGKAFSKMARLISIAVKELGPDPEANSKLRLAVETARSFNMPKENIERAIKKGSGEAGEEHLEEVIYEAFGPGGVALIIEGITDNKNRTLGEIKQILSQNGGKLAQEGSVKWLFERRGVITISSEQQSLSREDLELKAIEAEAENIYWHDFLLDVYTKPEDLEKVKKSVENQGIKIETASLDLVAKDMIAVSEEDKKACEALFESLDENDAVQEIYSNLKE
ncbi:MAG: YebC/PmpR family DNA-binding transcriptional regulator [Candidatus Staskawiczbacteria bacterium CG10_big_fil_rev_8_21_14_0_10_38_10]|uniref:Probable transcriptional regulatory protein COU98_01765 n=1 Tax=Candidatus Staskawiczbacteria bacterium CG10_big_fil_rev_8_21_14_0_10_38_10 TaxID=1974891 RepID=A0A2H9T192_9BACT|nr:MAG: YebC/PmpR family DNA-binding transcriptional regulator [Candidatus Staskawiczbacteria bacterium CG10_big_fil_rev_8_21_14_0_10_38_10]